MTYKYPYIPRPYYPAVMFACKMIQDDGYFNKAIRIAADYYNVNEKELEKHVRARQGAGQKGKTRTYKYYVLIGIHDRCLGGDEGYYDSYLWDESDYRSHVFAKTVKATSVENAKSDKSIARMTSRQFANYMEHGGSDDIVLYTKEFAKKSEAEEYISQLTTDDMMELISKTGRSWNHR